MKKLLSTIVLMGLFMLTHAQNSYTNGKKSGFWQHKDGEGRIYAEGNYTNDLRTGEWKFYVSDAARKQKTPDVLGNYADGNKEGIWKTTNLTSNITVSVPFENGLMNGECIYYNKEKTILARGLVKDGIRHGKWILYDKKSKVLGYYKEELMLRDKMSEGYYKDGIRLGRWEYNYNPDAATEVKGHLTFEDGVNSGAFEFYKVETHEIFGPTKVLSGVGRFSNGKKTGRWIEFRNGAKGDYIETGDYNDNGKREGLWKIKIGGQDYMTSYYKDGKLEGEFKHYYANGNLMYETQYRSGLEVGEFKRYYKNGNIMEQGYHIVSDEVVQKDTTFLSLKLPYEHMFKIVEGNIRNIHLAYIKWLEEPAWSIAPAELDRRFNVYSSYGQEEQARIAKITTSNKVSVRDGDYLAFYENGKLRLKGNNIAGLGYIFDPLKSEVVYDFLRDGDWKEYDKKGHLKYTYKYEKGKLHKMLDSNGYIVHTFKYEKNRLVGMTDGEGNQVSINLDK